MTDDLRARVQASTVPVLRSDVKDLRNILFGYIDLPEVWGETIARLDALLAATPAQSATATVVETEVVNCSHEARPAGTGEGQD